MEQNKWDTNEVEKARMDFMREWISAQERLSNQIRKDVIRLGNLVMVGSPGKVKKQ